MKKNIAIISLLVLLLLSFRPYSVSLEKIRVTSAGQASAWAQTTADVLLVVDVSSTIANATAAFPSAPIDGQIFGFSTRSAITSLTLSAGSPISGSVSTAAAGFQASWIYDQASNRWFRYQ